MIEKALSALPGGAFGAKVGVMVVMFLLGFFLDFIEITFVVVPLVAVSLLKLSGVDPVWLGVMMAVNLQTSFLSPPVAMAPFYLKGVAPKHVTIDEIFKGVMPFLYIVLLSMVLFYAFPKIGLGLPEYLYNHKSPRCETKKAEAGGSVAGVGAAGASVAAAPACRWQPRPQVANPV